MGGLGKTTLARLVHNHERVVKYFDLRMWVCVSTDFEVKILVRNIIRSATGIHVQNLELDQLKIQLHKELNQKRYLLVLDNVWDQNPEKWDELRTLLSIGANGSKIVVTTRSRTVASIAGIQYYLSSLTQSESWALFEKTAFRHEDTVINPNLLPIGREIMRICEGIPLFIEIIGAMLCYKTEATEWSSIANNERLISLRDGVNVLTGKSLRTLFLLSDHDSKDDAIANTIISSCRGLRVLHLNALIDKKVSQSIVKLIQLRYLDLSNSDFEVLPGAITMLQNLQTLRLLRCGKLKELPGDIEKLLNLRHLEIQGCERLTHMPSGLGQLSML
ncbi:putative disease resistance protein RGA4 [Vitis riparia]|uniref:putative disease resistance protein RGA4 n=1 Tax=Vitis riparia TaxID=96939 RepID=UPI00155B3F34|nr:putative disease resistance protein RGA4 [Vitis riparia]